MRDGEALSGEALREVQLGLRMAHPPDPEQLARERARLVALAGAPVLARLRGYGSLLGPGYLQSAMTLGGGTASAAIFSGAVFGYALLWVPPVGMALGLVVMAAVAHQTLSTGQRPFAAMRRHAGWPLAYAWALGALLASIIWHFPQYALASAVLVDMGEALGRPGISPAATGAAVLVVALALSALYGRSPALVRRYERTLRALVWLVVLCFGAVVWQTGIQDWGALLRGFTALAVPGERSGVAGATLVLSGLSAAIGINMVFLYPYSLLARGWGREHRRLARFDLAFGMFVPYAVAASLIAIATANTVHLDPHYDGTRLAPVEAAQSLTHVIGPVYGRLVFGLGILAMALSSITLQMLVAGFVCAELFGWEFGGRRYRLATLLPVPGVLGCVFWSDVAVWVAVPTNIVCGLFLPAAYVGFITLQRSRAYLGADRPTGARAGLWLAGMVLATAVLVVFLGGYALTQGSAYLRVWLGG